MLASYDKIIKYLVEKFQTALAPLDILVRNQEAIIIQNKQMIELLARMSNCREPGLVQEKIPPADQTVPEENAQPES